MSDPWWASSYGPRKSCLACSVEWTGETDICWCCDQPTGEPSFHWIWEKWSFNNPVNQDG